MARRLACLILVGLGLGSVETTAQDRLKVRHHPTTPPVVLTTDTTIQGSLDRIASGSASWRADTDDLGRLGRRVLIVTPDRVVVADQVDQPVRIFDRSVLAEVAGHLQHVDGVDVLLVVVNLPLLQSMHDARGSLRREFEADLDRVLAHEVYGHAFPFLRAGDASGRCPDPAAGERAAEACSIRRENVVRAELGLGRRVDAGVMSLALARPGWSLD